MNGFRSLLTLTLVLFLGCLTGYAQESANQHISKRYNIFFEINKYSFDKNFRDNARTIEIMREDIQTTLQMDGVLPDSLLILSTASPDGRYSWNQVLAKNRAESTRKLLLEMFPEFKDAHIQVGYLEEDWDGLYQVLKANPNFPQREEMMEIIEHRRATWRSCRNPRYWSCRNRMKNARRKSLFKRKLPAPHSLQR